MLKQSFGEYRVSNGALATEYTTDDLAEAVQRGREMAQPRPPARTDRTARLAAGLMYRHDKRLLPSARERRKAGAIAEDSPALNTHRRKAAIFQERNFGFPDQAISAGANPQREDIANGKPDRRSELIGV